MNDCLGREIKVGDVITYPGRYSSSLYIRTAVVRAAAEDCIEVTGYGKALDGTPYSYKAQVVRTERATITGLTEKELMERLGGTER